MIYFKQKALNDTKLSTHMMKSCRLSIATKDARIQFVTMHNMTLDEFFAYMDKHPTIAAQFEHNIKQDYKREKIPPPPSVLHLWKKNLYRFKKMSIYLLVHKQQYVGSYRVHPVKVDGKQYFKIGVVYIVPQYRKQGLAHKMLSVVMHKQCILDVKHTNQKAYQLYKKLGFKKYQQNDNSIEMTNT